MNLKFLIFMLIAFSITHTMHLVASSPISLGKRVGDFRKMGEQELVGAIRKAVEFKIAETMEIKECQNVGKQWSLAFPRLEKLSPKQLDNELKDTNEGISTSRKCVDDEQEIVVLIKGLVIAKKNNLTTAQEKLANLLEGESSVIPQVIE